MVTFSLGEFHSATSYLIFDVDNDGDVDLLEIWQDVDTTANVTTWLNDSLGGFEESITTHSFGSFTSANSHLVLDANNDGFKDLVIIWSGVDGTANATAYLGDGEGSFGEFGEFVDTWDFGDFDPETTYLNLDYNNDGLDDIVALNNSSDNTSLATVWLSNGLGNFTISVDQQMDTFSLGESTSANSYLIFDVDNDADVDLLEIWPDLDSSAKITTWLNDSLGGFEESLTTHSFGSFASENSHLVLDANNDGFKDLVIIWEGVDGTANATAYLGDGEGRFGEFGEFVDTWDFGDFDPKTTYLNLDYNNDSLDDILAINDSPENTALATVWFSDGLGSFTL